MLTVLDKAVGLALIQLELVDSLFVQSSLLAAVSLINRKQDIFTEDERKAISQISFITITGCSDVYLGETSHTGMTLSIDYMKKASQAWVGSLLAHEGQHALNNGMYKGDDLWKDEQVAGQIQLQVGKKIGFTLSEIAYLENWISPNDKQQMECHMKAGYTC